MTIDALIVEQYLNILTKDDIKVIEEWTYSANIPINRLIKLYLKIKNIEPISNLTVYRGMGLNLSYQEKMDLFEKRFLMYFLIKGVKEGYEFTYKTPRPLSFTYDYNVAKSFGNVIVTSIFNKSIKYLNFTKNLIKAVSYELKFEVFPEVVLLETNKEIHYKVFKINLF